MNKSEIIIEIVEKVSQFSKDPSTKVGALAIDDNFRVLSIGYNGLPSKYPDNYEELSREKKLAITIHAEINCILNAAKNGVSLKDSTMYISEPCCSNCAAAMVNAGIKKVVFPSNYSLSKAWLESIDLAKQVFKTCKVEIEQH